MLSIATDKRGYPHNTGRVKRKCPFEHAHNSQIQNILSKRKTSSEPLLSKYPMILLADTEDHELYYSLSEYTRTRIRMARSIFFFYLEEDICCCTH